MKKYFKVNGDWAILLPANNDFAITESGKVWIVSEKRYKNFLPSRPYQELTVSLGFGNGSTKYKVHRLVAEYFLTPVEGMNIVDHIDNNTHNNHVNNLRWATKTTNANNRYDQKGVMCVKKIARKEAYNVFLGRYDTKAEADEVLRKALIGLSS